MDEARVNGIKKLADKLISQGRTDIKFIQDKKDSIVEKYVLVAFFVIYAMEYID